MDQEKDSPDQNTIFQIEIAGQLHGKWSHWLNGTIVKIKGNVNKTLITIAVPDQAGLRGVINKLWDLNMTIISMTQQVNPSNQGECHED